MAKPYKQEKKAYKKAKRRLVQPWKALTILCIVLALIFSPLMVVLNMFDNTVAAFVGGTNAQFRKDDFSEN